MLFYDGANLRICLFFPLASLYNVAVSSEAMNSNL